MPFVEKSDESVESSRETDWEKEFGELKQVSKLVIGDFDWVKFAAKTLIIYCVGRIEKVHSFSD